MDVTQWPYRRISVAIIPISFDQCIHLRRVYLSKVIVNNFSYSNYENTPRMPLYKYEPKKTQLNIIKMATTNDVLPNQRLLGKVAIVTGGAHGIGESIVRVFHKHGAKVCLVDVADDDGKRLCDSLGNDPNLCYVHCDVTKEDDVKHAVDFTVSKFSKLDILVNNAAVMGPICPDIRNVNLSDFDRVIDVNVKGVFLGMKHAARVMIPSKRGSIVSISSVASVQGGIAQHAYTVSKHAVLGLTKNVAAELGQHGIRVNCVAPYGIPTKLSVPDTADDYETNKAVEEYKASIAKNANLQGVELTGEDVANAVMFLASDEARYISGDNLMVDGGFTSVNHNLKVFRE